MAKETRPDVVILDVEIPVMGAQAGAEAAARALAVHRVIIVTVFADRRLVRELLGLGASAYSGQERLVAGPHRHGALRGPEPARGRG